ncbi:MAG: glycerate kinase [Phormidesmis sp.]
MRSRAAIWEPAAWQTIVAWGRGQQPNASQMEQLKAWTQRTQQAAVWQLDDQALSSALNSRGQLLQTICAQWVADALGLPMAGAWTDWIAPLWLFWLPLAQRIDQAQRLTGRPFVQGVLGVQGTGKTTLCRIIRLILEELGQRAVGLSIDDLYLSCEARRELRKQDARLIWRGPPGTHDVPLGLEVLSAVQRDHPAQSIALPRFDKSAYGGQGDRTTPIIVKAPTVVLFEGWFIGTEPLPATTMSAPDFSFPDPICTEADRQFARDCNQRLSDYLPLWSLLDSLIVLQPQDYRFSVQWRQAAERQMMATGKDGLSEAQIAEFVQYFWKALHPELFITPLTLSKRTSLVVNICHNHQLDSLYLP